MENNKETFGEIKPFTLNATYQELDALSPLNVHDDHIHNECEIYVNLSGDVSFAVENSVYPLVPGGIVITRPFEHHHCLYHTNKLHRHFWITFTADGNERLLRIFYDREPGKGNMLLLPGDKNEELFSLCRTLSVKGGNEVERYCCFFRLIDLMNNASDAAAPNDPGKDWLMRAVSYIQTDLSRRISVSALASKCGVSVNTLERHFLREFNTSPSDFIRKKRLANAIKLLNEGYSVTESAEMSGFSDCSSFISLFKQTYHTTPLKYKNRQKRSEK